MKDELRFSGRSRLLRLARRTNGQWILGMRFSVFFLSLLLVVVARGMAPDHYINEYNADYNLNYHIDDSVEDAQMFSSAWTDLNQDEFYLLSHGKPGILLIGNQWLGARDIALWIVNNNVLNNQKQLNIYGCEFAKGQKGKAAVAYLENTLAITIAASTNITGKDGDWVLETTNQDFFKSFSNYQHNLQLTGPMDDFDGDGIQNQDDLDDDNDGILDIIEQNCPTGIISNTSPQVMATSEIGASGPGVSVLVNGVITENTSLLNAMNIANKELFKFEFDSPVTLSSIEIGTHAATVSFVFPGAKLIVQGSKDNINWTNLTQEITMIGKADDPMDHGPGAEFFELDLVDEFKYYRIYGISGNSRNAVFLQEAYFRGGNCTELDTDGDSFSNQYDLDSDGDTCSDANEAGVTRSLTPDFAFATSGVGVNGFFDELEETPDGNRYNGFYTYGQAIDGISNCYVPNCTNPNNIGCDCDYDGDGLMNQYDADDDNDGIRDLDECEAMSAIVSNGHFDNNASGWQGFVFYDGRANSPFRGDLYSLIVGQDDNPLGSIQSYSDNPSDGAYITMDLKGGEGYIYTFDLGIWSDFVHPSNPYDLLVEVRDASASTVILTLENPSLYADIKNHPASKDGLGTAINTRFVQFDGKFSVPSDGTYTLFFKTAGTGSQPADYFIDRVAVDGERCTQNTDGDEFPDKYDLDSDNDGCADFVEGAGSFTLSDGVVAGGSASSGTGSSVTDNLCADASCVDIQGIPLNAGTPQGIGSSQNAAVQDPDCTPTCSDNPTAQEICNIVTADPTGSLAMSDCDGDGVTNKTECDNGTVPTDSCSYDLVSQDYAITSQEYKDADCDGDGVSNGEEIDPDGDGTPGGTGPNGEMATDPQDECSYETSLQDYASTSQAYKDADCDGDGVSNGEEIDPDGDGTPGGTGPNGEMATDPQDECSYESSLQDFASTSQGYKDGDCDGDGVTNGDELNPPDGETPTDPLDPCSFIATDITLTPTPSIDTDGDNVSDACDLDDDNDGILDTDEGYICQGNDPFAPVDPPVINDGVTALSDLYDGVNGIGAKFNAVNDRLVLDLSQVVAAGTVIKIETNANSNGANNTTLNISQSDNTGGSLSNPVDISPTSTTSTNTDYILDAATQYITLTMTVRTSGRIEVDYVEVQEICNELDTDMDGIPNHLDLDSDGDGCPDAVEGGGSYTPSDVVTDTNMDGGNTGPDFNGDPMAGPVQENLGVIVDSDGIPNTDGDINTDDSQGIGDSQNSAITTACAVNKTLAENDINQTPVDTPVDGNVLTNDSDPEGDTQMVTLIDTDGDGIPDTAPTPGTPQDIGDGTLDIDPTTGEYTFTPDPSFMGGEVVIAYEVCDDGSPVACETATLVIQVMPEEDPMNGFPPVVNDDNGTTDPMTPVDINILSNDSDPDGTIDPTTVDLDETSVPGGSCTMTDVDGDCIEVTVSGEGVYAVDETTGVVTFTPDPMFEGETTPLEYSVEDNEGNTGIGTISVEVVEDDPAVNEMTAEDDANSGLQGDELTGNVLDNDIDPDGSDMTPTVNAAAVDSDGDGMADDALPIGTPTDIYVDGMLAGKLLLNPDGSYTWNAEPGFVGTVTIPYTSCDNNSTMNACDNATLVLTTISAPNETSAENDINQTPVDTPVDGNVLTNDSDPEGDTQMVTLIDTDGDGIPDTAPTPGTPQDIGGGTLDIDPTTGEYTFTPDPSFMGGEIVIAYEVCDDGSPVACETATLVIQVIPVEDPMNGFPPVVNDDNGTTDPMTPVDINILSNDSDPDGTIDPTTVDLDETSVPGGSCTMTDVDGDCIEVTVSGEGVYAVDETTGVVTFTPDPMFEGETTPLEYSVEDDEGNSGSGTISVEVVEDDPAVNEMTAEDDANSGLQGDELTGNVLDNDIDPDGSDMTPTVNAAAVDSDGDGMADDALPIGTPTDIYVDGILAGELLLNPDGSYTWNAEPDFVGTVTIPYTVCDNNSTMDACDNATLVLTTVPVPNETSAEDDINQTPEDLPVDGNVLTNDSDPEGDTQMVTQIDTDGDGIPDTAPTPGTPQDIGDGTLDIDPATGEYTFTPAPGFVGTVEITYEVCDDGSPVACETATLVIDVVPDPNSNGDIPAIALNDNGTTTPDTPVDISILSNDSDPDGMIDPMSVSLNPSGITGATCDNTVDGDCLEVTVPNEGTYTVDPTTGVVTFDPAPGFIGETTPLTYEVCDDTAPTPLCDEATISISVEEDDPAVNEMTAQDDANSGAKGDELMGNVLDNDIDPEDPMDTDGSNMVTGATVENESGMDVSLPIGMTTTIYKDGTAIGDLTLNEDGSYTWMPEDNFEGTVTIPYTSCDGDVMMNACDGATLILTAFTTCSTELTPVFSIQRSTFVNGDEVDGVYTIQNISSSDICDRIVLSITLATESFTTELLETTTMIDFNEDGTPETPVDNPDWEFFPSGTQVFAVLRPTKSIAPGGFSRIGLRFKAIGTPSSTSLTTLQINTDTAGDINPDNNFAQGTFIIN